MLFRDNAKSDEALKPDCSGHGVSNGVCLTFTVMMGIGDKFYEKHEGPGPRRGSQMGGHGGTHKLPLSGKICTPRKQK